MTGPTCGGAATRPKASPGWRTARAGRTCPHQTRLGGATDRGAAPSRGLGPARIAGIVGLPASTVHRVLVRHGLNRLRPWTARPGQPIRRIEMTRPGELVHIDIKKLARIPPAAAGGSTAELAERQHGSRHQRSATPTCTPPSTPTPDSPTARSLDDEQGRHCVAFLDRAVALFAEPRHHRRTGPHRQRHLLPQPTPSADRSSSSASRHTRTRPYRPATNGKVERFNRTLLDEWAYARPWTSERPTHRALDRWLHRYNHHRHHTAIGGPPISRVNNLPGHYT